MTVVTALISLILLVVGMAFMFVSGAIHEEGDKDSAAFGATLATLILLMSWVLA